MTDVETNVRKKVPKTVNGIEIVPLVAHEIIIDNLSRIGIANRKDKKLFASCYLITTEEGKDYIAHFKDLLKVPSSDDSDHKRRNTIIWLLEKWGLIKIVGNPDIPIQKRKLFILTKEQLAEGWEIVHKYHYFKQNKEVT